MAKNQTLVILPSLLRERLYNGQKRTGVVFILGWVGSQFRHLYSFAQIYEELGIASIMYSFRTTTFHSVLPRKTITSHAKYLLKEMHENGLDGLPVFFHLFSNGGSIMYHYLLKEIEKPEHRLIHFGGVVFDSCPSNFLSPEAASAYLKVMAVDNYYLTSIMGGCFCALAYLNLGLNKCLDFISGETEGLEKLYFARNTLTANNNGKYPHLFMYSKSDKIVSFNEIEKFIRDREKCGIRVSTNCWDDSDHCTHQHKFPDEYKAILKTFIVEECFNELPFRRDKIKKLIPSYEINSFTSEYAKIEASGLRSKL